MKNKLMTFAAAAIAVAGLTFAFASSGNDCPLEGTPECPKIDCPLAGGPECPVDANAPEVPDCCGTK